MIENFKPYKKDLFYSQIGVDFALKVINWDPNTLIRLQLWDIAGNYFIKLNIDNIY